MPVKLDYPTDGLDIISGIDLIEKLNNLGGKASLEVFAENIGMSRGSGPFRGKISSLSKYHLVKYDNSAIELADLAIKILNAYSEQEKKLFLLESLLSVPIFYKLTSRYYKDKISISLLDKVLIREYNIPKRHSLSLKKIFLIAGKNIGVINEDGTFERNLVQKVLNKFENIKDKEIKEDSIGKDSKLEIKYDDEIRLDNDIFNLIVNIASKINPKKEITDFILKVIEKYPFLTHTKLTFEVLKKDFKNETIQQKDIDVLLNAIKYDLNIK